MAFQFLFFFRELVVVGELLTGEDLPEGEDDDVLLAQDVDNLAVAVGLKWNNIN